MKVTPDMKTKLSLPPNGDVASVHRTVTSINQILIQTDDRFKLDFSHVQNQN